MALARQPVVNFVQYSYKGEQIPQRFDEFIRVINDIPGIVNKGFSLSLASMPEFISEALKEDRPLVIAINVHGFVECDNRHHDSGRAGNFHGNVSVDPKDDPRPGDPPNVDEEVFWNGCLSAGKQTWLGMKKILHGGNYNNSKPIYIILAQCQGLKFAERLRNIIREQNQEDPTPQNVIIHGCSWGSTWSTSSPSKYGPDATTQYRHKELQETVETIVKREQISMQ